MKEKEYRYRGIGGEDAKALTTGDDPGWIEGYLAVFGNPDQYNEVILKGAFAKTLSELVPARRVPLMVRHFCHGGDAVDCVGTVVEAREDDYGLWIKAEFAKTTLAQEIRQLVVDKHVQGLSVGYQIINAQAVQIEDKHYVGLTELRLREGTITCKPVNEEALITAAKAIEFAAEGGVVDTIGRPTLTLLQGAVDRFQAVLGKALSTPPAEPESEDKGKACPDLSVMSEARRIQLEMLKVSGFHNNL